MVKAELIQSEKRYYANLADRMLISNDSGFLVLPLTIGGLKHKEISFYRLKDQGLFESRDYKHRGFYSTVIPQAPRGSTVDEIELLVQVARTRDDIEESLLQLLQATAIDQLKRIEKQIRTVRKRLTRRT